MVACDNPHRTGANDEDRTSIAFAHVEDLGKELSRCKVLVGLRFRVQRSKEERRKERLQMLVIRY